MSIPLTLESRAARTHMEASRHVKLNNQVLFEGFKDRGLELTPLLHCCDDFRTDVRRISKKVPVATRPRIEQSPYVLGRPVGTRGMRPWERLARLVWCVQWMTRALASCIKKCPTGTQGSNAGFQLCVICQLRKQIDCAALIRMSGQGISRVTDDDARQYGVITGEFLGQNKAPWTAIARRNPQYLDIQVR